MKDILITIKPELVQKIASGECTILVRKTRPKLETPFKCYIYQTKSRDNAIYKQCKVDDIRSGKVIGEFTCDRLYEFTYNHNVGEYNIGDDSLKRTYLTYDEIKNYGKCKDLYGWHISNLKIYDKAEYIEYYGKPCEYVKYDDFFGCWYCEAWEWSDCGFICPMSSGGENNDYEDGGYCMGHGRQPRFQPPADWCYVDEVKE